MGSGGPVTLSEWLNLFGGFLVTNYSNNFVQKKGIKRINDWEFYPQPKCHVGQIHKNFKTCDFW